MMGRILGVLGEVLGSGFGIKILRNRWREEGKG